MIVSNFNIKDWKIKLFIFDGDYFRYSDLLESLYYLRCSSKQAKQSYKIIFSNKSNTGFTYANTFLKQALIYIGDQDTDTQLINTICHESRHLQQYISNYYNLDQNSEEVCYLIGYIASKIFEICKDNYII